MSYSELQSIDIHSESDFAAVINNGVVRCNVVIRNDSIRNIIDVKVIHGSLGISECSITTLGSIEKIDGDFWTSNQFVLNNLQDTGQLIEVGGNCSLRHSRIKSLGRLECVGGTLNLRDTPIQDLGNLKKIAGNLLLPKESKNKLNLDKIEIEGKVTFWKSEKDNQVFFNQGQEMFAYHTVEIVDWPHFYIYSLADLSNANAEQKEFYIKFKNAFNDGIYFDIKGNYNYAFILLYDLIERYKNDIASESYFNTMIRLAHVYPILGPYIYPSLITNYKLIGEFEKAWQIIKETNKVDLFSFLEFQNHLSKSLFSEVGIMFFAQKWVLTDFGQDNLDTIVAIANKTVLESESGQNSNFTDVFFVNQEIECSIINEGLNLKFQSDLDLEYYSTFFSSNEEYQIAKEKHISSGNYSGFPMIIREAILAESNKILRNAEDEFRLLNGMPKIGEGWINETRLYYEISKYFVGYKVVQHASPTWLGRQHLDIYFPIENVGIEYQGIQHYRPVEFFGGELAYEKTKERDSRKRLLCLQNNCRLIQVNEGYCLEDVLKNIENVIFSL